MNYRRTSFHSLLGLCILVAALGDPGVQAAPAARRPPPTPTVTFYTATLSSADFQDWPLWLATQGSKLFGFTYGGSNPVFPDLPDWFTLKGNIKSGKATANVVEYSQRQPRKQGSLSGQLSGDTISGKFTLQGHDVAFSASRVQPAEDPAGITGPWTGAVGGTQQTRFTVNINANHTFHLDGTIFTRYTGSADGIWLPAVEGDTHFVYLFVTKYASTYPSAKRFLKVRAPLKGLAVPAGPFLLIRSGPGAGEGLAVLQRPSTTPQSAHGSAR